MQKKKDDSIKTKALMAGLLGSLPATLAAGGLVRLSQGKGAKILHAGPKITETEAERFPRKAFGKDPLIEFVGNGIPSSGRTVKLPVVGRKEMVPLPAAAHEFAHAAGGPIQATTKFLRSALFMQPATRVGKLMVRSPAISPLHIPLLLAASSPKGKDEKGVSKFVKEHPAALASLLAAGPLAGEAHASLKGLAAIKKLYGSKTMMKSAPPMARALAATISAYLPAVATIWGTSKIRDILQRRHEKTAGDFKNLLETSTHTPVYYGRLKEMSPVNTRRPRGASERKVELHSEE